MAGITEANYRGENMVSDVQVPAIGGAEGRKNLSPEARTAPIVKTAHLNESRAEGVAYDCEESIGVKGPENKGYPAGTDFGESSNPLRP